MGVSRALTDDRDALAQRNTAVGRHVMATMLGAFPKVLSDDGNSEGSMPPSPDPRDSYAARLTQRRTTLGREEGRHLALGNVRIALFLLGVGMLFALYLRDWFSAWWLVLPVAALIGLGRRLQHVENRIARLNRSIGFYQQGLDRLDDRWVGKGEDGSAFLNEDHLYASDLDVLGHGSLFQRVCAARTERGLATLADWLLTRASIDVGPARHDAVRELAPRLDLREDLAVAGERAHHHGGAAALVAWSAEPPRAFSVAGQAA